MAEGAVSMLVLVVDDEDVIHLLLRDALEEGGYSVDAALEPEQALTLLEQKHAEYRAVITDVNMGKGKPTGWEVARRARELNADIPVIYMTGDSGGDWTVSGVPNSVLILKPFAAAQVVTAVSTLVTEANMHAAPSPDKS